MSGQAFAVSIGNVTLATGANTDAASDHTVWRSDNVYDSMGGLSNIGPQPGPYEPNLVGNPAPLPGKVGSNIELGTYDDAGDLASWLAGTTLPTTLSGNFGGTKPIALSSLVLGDWTANGNELAKAYITDALATLGIPISDPDLSTAATAFIYGVPMFGIVSPAFKLSDPNVAYVNLLGTGVVEIGLEGLLDATEVLQPLADLVGISLPAQPQASEVVKVTYAGDTKYLYSFSAQDTSQNADDCPPGTPHAQCSYSGDYRVTIPEPTSLALLGLGIAGLGWTRGRRREA
jgi:hypothetical protein